jgi:uncharacterized iron-regulated membrane protein
LKQNPQKKSRFRRVNEWLHLWLSLISGIVVFVVCLTAAIWVMRDEVAYFTKSFNRIDKQDRGYLLPTQLRSKVEHYLDSTWKSEHYTIDDITYREHGKTALVSYSSVATQESIGDIHVNPYSGKIQYNEIFEDSNTLQFFIFVRAGHRFFWLPEKAGSTVVGSSCLVFLVILITGLIWWYPSKWTNSTRKKSFTVKWNAKWKRLNIDLHNVLGFYAMLFVFILSFTGVYYSFKWFKDTYHAALGVDVEHAKNEMNIPKSSDTTVFITNPVDDLWRIHYSPGTAADFLIAFPADTVKKIAITRNPQPGKFYKRYTVYYDKQSLAQIPSDGIRNRKFDELSASEKLVRMNFDLHVGSIGGLPTKILACIASLIGASLPVTGFIVWYNRKWGKKKTGKKMVPSLESQL